MNSWVDNRPTSQASQGEVNTMSHKNRTLWMIVTVMMIAGLLAACGAPADTTAAPAEGMAEEMEMADDAAVTLAAELEEASGACYIEPAPASLENAAR